jgi:dTDP-4-amino-4,6-dideoxygalactose transaminase
MKIMFNNLFLQNKIILKKINKNLNNIILNSDFILGKEVKKFEEKFSKQLNVKHCIACGNGTDALYLSIRSLGLKQGQEVITTSHSWIATSETITQAGGKVVFCDTNKNDFNISVDQIKKKITKKTAGIICVHLHGNPCDVVAIKKIAKKNNLWIIEDCAQAHLSKIKNKHVGSFGDIGTFSFYPGKNLGAMGDAGCVVTNNSNLEKRIRLLANHGGKNKHLIEGINSRMDTFQAAILNLKIPFLKRWTSRRIAIANYYIRKLKNISQIILPNYDSENVHTFHQFVIKAKKRDLLRKFLFKRNIDTNIHYSKILPELPAYRYLKFNDKDFLNSKNASRNILSLPLFPEINKKQLDYIVRVIKEFYNTK